MTDAAIPDPRRLRRGAAGVALPPILWAAHFISVYGLFAAACAPRGLVAAETARIAVAAGAALSLLLITACGRWAAAGGPGGVLGVGALWSAIISAVAVATQTLPAALFDLCG